MKRIAVRVTMVILSSLLLLLLLLSLNSSVLFSPENLSSTPYQLQLQSLHKASTGESPQILPLMQEVMSGTASITISLDEMDFRSAERDLRHYLEKSSQLENIIIRLNLTDTNLETFRQEAEQNFLDLQEMLNLTERFSSLESIEINYRPENSPDLLYTVSYEGETIRNRVDAIAENYASRKSTLVNISQSYNLDTTAYERSTTAVSSIAQGVVVRQTDRAVNLEKVTSSPYLLDLSLDPITSEYGEEITFSGYFISGPSSARGISLFVDSVLWKEVTADLQRGYQILYPVRQIRAGEHIVYAQHEHTYSEIQTFTVRSSPSQITLKSQIEGHQILCIGTLFTGNIPVSSAPIELYIDGKPVRTVFTDNSGSYATRLDLSSGEHRIEARFSSREFPLEPSEVEIFTESIEDTGSSVISSFLGLIVFAGCGGAAAWFLLRRHPSHTGVMTSPDRSSPIQPAKESSLADLSLTLSSYWGMLLRGDVQEGVHLLYRTLVDTIGHLRKISHAPTLTPRELAGKVPDLAPDLPEFVARYEKIRYAGILPTEQEHETFTSRFVSLIRFLRGGSH